MMMRIVSVVLIILFRPVRAFSVNSSTCQLLEGHIDRFIAQQEVKWSRQRLGPTLTFLPFGGIGDQASGYLGAVIMAMITGRFLMVPHESFWFNGVAPMFTTGEGHSNTKEDTEMIARWVCDYPRERRMKLYEFLTTRRHRSKNQSVAWTNMYCADHQLNEMERSGGLGRYFTATHERIRVGNIGHRLFDVWLQRLGILPKGRLISTNPNVRGVLYPCVFRRLLKPSIRVEHAVAEALKPTIGERVLPTVGIHVRASRYLSKSAYRADNDDVFRCDAPQLDAQRFTDIWEAARMLEIKLAVADPDDVNSHARWFVVSDSGSLKKSALDTFGSDKIRVTPLRPTHPTDVKVCSKSDAQKNETLMIPGNIKIPQNLTPEEEVILELVLLSQVDALLIGSSRFSSLAVFWCASCRSIWFYTECARRDCLPLYGVEDEEEPGLRKIYTAGSNSEGDQMLVGNHAVIDKIRRSDGAFLPIFF